MSQFLRWAAILMALAVFVAGCTTGKQEPTPPQTTRSFAPGYPASYRVKPITRQLEILVNAFPELRNYKQKQTVRAVSIPEGAEGLFVIPQWQAIAPIYGEAVQRVLDALAKQRPFYNYRAERGSILLQTERTAAMWKKLAESQNYVDILLVPAQFGLRHRGKSVEQARASFSSNEFGLGAYAVGIMLLTHPERLQNADDLWIDAAGDGYTHYADGDFSATPFFGFLGDRVRFEVDYGHAGGMYGSASAFLP